MVDETEPQAIVHDRRKTDPAFDKIIKGVDLLAQQVVTLNERVYTKNSIDRFSKKLRVISVVTFVILSIVFAAFLVVIVTGNFAESDRAKDRAAEATEFRHQLADCQLAPGTVLKDGFVNPGVCYKDIENKTGEILVAAIDRISNGTKTSQDCLYLRGQGIKPPPCAEVNARVDAFKGGVNPFPPLPPLPGVQNSAVVTTRPTSTTSTSTTTVIKKISNTTTTTTTTGLVCAVLSLVGLC